MDNDFCEKDGANKLKKRIEEYWAARGATVSISLIDVGFSSSMRSGRTDLRSDMINGMPAAESQRRLSAAKKAPAWPVLQIAKRRRYWPR